MVKPDAVASFLETITLLDVHNGVTREAALFEGRQDLAVVLAALEQGHACLTKSFMIGESQRVFLQLTSEAMGMHNFLRAAHKTVHPKVLAQFVEEPLYPSDPPESVYVDDDLRYIIERFGKDDYRFPARILKVLANRKNERAAGHCGGKHADA